MTSESKIRVLIAKPGLDGHDRGARIVAYGLRDAGFEVIYTGLRQTPEEIARAAAQEDVQVVGLSILSGAHLALTERVVQGLAHEGVGDVLLIVGGVIPESDIPKLRSLGVQAAFVAGTPIQAVARYIRSNLNGAG